LVSIIPVDIEISSEEDSEHSEEYFLDRIIRTNKTNFRPIGISADTISNIKKIVETESKSISGKLNDIISNSESVRSLLPNSDELERILHSMSSQEIYTTETEPHSTILITSPESFIIISNKRTTANSLISTLHSDLQKIGNITKDFGLNYIGLAHGQKYAEYILKHAAGGISSFKIIPPKNDFEEKVSKYVSTITDCFFSNIDITFDSPRETFEYDILIPFDRTSIIDIEVKDYSQVKEEQHEDSETLKNKLILSPIDKAKRLNAEVIVLTKGFPSQVFQQLKEFAISRGVTLLDENNYKKEIQLLLIEQATQLVSIRERRRMARLGRRKLGRILRTQNI